MRSERDSRAYVVLVLQTIRGRRGQCVCATCDKFHAALTLVNTQDCLTVGSCPGTVAVIFILFFLAHGHLNYGNEGHSRGMS